LKKSLILPRTAEQLLQECVQEVGESGIGVEQACDRAKQVAQKITRTRHRRDAKMDRCQIHDQPEQVEVDPAYIEVEDLADGRRTHFASGAKNRRLRLGIKRLLPRHRNPETLL
jgi:hypothetical protein